MGPHRLCISTLYSKTWACSIQSKTLIKTAGGLQIWTCDNSISLAKFFQENLDVDWQSVYYDSYEKCETIKGFIWQCQSSILVNRHDSSIVLHDLQHSRNNHYIRSYCEKEAQLSTKQFVPSPVRIWITVNIYFLVLQSDFKPSAHLLNRWNNNYRMILLLLFCGEH